MSAFQLVSHRVLSGQVHQRRRYRELSVHAQSNLELGAPSSAQLKFGLPILTVMRSAGLNIEGCHGCTAPKNCFGGDRAGLGPGHCGPRAGPGQTRSAPTLELLYRDEAAPLFKVPGYSPYAGRNFPTRVLWGDTHLHTANSLDAAAFGNTLGPEEALRFARGEEIVSSSGQRVKLSRPLDFLVVADHAEGWAPPSS